MSLRDDLSTFIRVNVLGGDRIPLAPETSLVETGLLDSVSLMNLIVYVEDRTGVRIPDAEVTPENFNTVASIELLVERLRGTA